MRLVRLERLAYSCQREWKPWDSPGRRMSGPILCMQCEKTEEKCTCEKYCCFCQSQQGIRMCIDGLYYCPDCREAVDVRVVDARGE